MNHGYCKNCWWYLSGRCYMHMTHVTERDYCPDYMNRIKEKDSLINWIFENDIDTEF